MGNKTNKQNVTIIQLIKLQKRNHDKENNDNRTKVTQSSMLKHMKITAKPKLNQTMPFKTYCYTLEYIAAANNHTSVSFILR